MLVPKNVVTDYSPEFVTAHPQWQPSTLPQRMEKSLAGSKATYKFVMLHELVIPVNERCWHVFRQDNAKRMQLEYYAAFGEKPYDTVNISELLTSN